MLVAVIVIFPKLVALIVLLSTAQPWRPRDSWVFFLVFMAGLASLVDIVFLAVWETQGSSWKEAAALREHAWMEDGANVLIYVADGLPFGMLGVSRARYRPQLLWGIAIGLICGYVSISGIVMGAVWALRRRSQEQFDGCGDGSDSSGSDSSDGVNDLGRSFPPPRAAIGRTRWCQRVGPWVRGRRLWQLQRALLAHPPLSVTTSTDLGHVTAAPAVGASLPTDAIITI